MPLAGFVCPVGGEAPGRQNTVDYCISACTRPCVTAPLMGALWQANQTNYHTGDYISASMIAGSNCMRQTANERFEPYFEQPTRLFWPFRGTLAHRLCEDAQGFIDRFGWLQEMRMQVTLQYPDEPAPVFDLVADEGGTLVKRFTGRYDHSACLEIQLQGTADAYNPFTRKYVDQKSMADKKAEMTVKGTKDGTFSKNLQDEHVWQFNIYRWLIARTAIPAEVRAKFRAFGLPDLKGRNFPAPTELVMQGFSMMHMVRSGSQYPWTEGYGANRATTLYDIDPVPVLPLSEIEEFIRPRALVAYRALVLRQPAPVLPASKKWMCNSCAFNGERVPGGTCFPEAERKAAKGVPPVLTP